LVLKTTTFQLRRFWVVIADIVISRRSPLLSAKGFSTGRNAADRWIRLLLKGELVMITPGASSATNHPARPCITPAAETSIAASVLKRSGASSVRSKLNICAGLPRLRRGLFSLG